MAKVKIKNLKILQGSTYVHSFTVYKESGVLYPLDGFEARMQMRPTVGSAATFFSGDTTSGEIVIDEANSEITLTIQAATSSAWVDYSGVYDLEIFKGTFVKRISKGTVSIDKVVTR